MASGLGVSSILSRLRLMVAFAVVPPLIIVAFTALQWRNHEVDDSRTTIVLIARHLSDSYGRQLERVRATLARAVRASQSGRTDSEVAGALAEILRQEGCCTALGVLTASNRLISNGVSSAPPPAFTDRTIFRRARESGQVEIGESDFDPATRRVTRTFALAGAVNPRGGRDVVFAVGDLAWVPHIAAAETLIPGGGTVTVFDASGRTLSRWPALVPQTGAAPHDGVVRAARETRGEGTTLARDPTNGDQIVAFAPIPLVDSRNDLFVSVSMPRRSATVIADRLLLGIVGAFALLLVSGLSAASVVSNRLLMRPVRTMIDTTRRLARGELTTTLDVPDAPAELQQLIQEINAMASSLRDREAELQRASDQAETEMRRFRALVDHVSYGMGLLDRRGTFVCASLPAARLLGVALPDLPGRHLTAFVHEEDRDVVAARIAEVSLPPQGFCVVTFRARTYAGSWRRVEARIRNLIGDPQVGALAMTCRPIADGATTGDHGAPQTDMLADRWAEEALERLSRAIEQTADSIIVTNREGVIEYVNPAFETMTGYTREDAVGRTPRLLRSGVHTREFYADLWRTILAGRPFRCVTTNRARDGRLYDEEQTIAPIRDASGAITHFVSTGRDITQRKRTQEALRRLNRQLEEQAARIAAILHDEAGQFLTSAHIGLADLARNLAEPLRDRVCEIRRHLDAVEERLRGISHEIHPSVVQDLGLSEAVRFLAEGFSSRTGIGILVQSSLNGRRQAAAEVVIYRCVQEALSNIGRHSHATSGEIILGGNDRTISCTIRDNGVGFDVEAATKGRHVSLGLRGMQDRLEAAGGTLVITSSPGGGTELKAQLPAEIRWASGC